MVMDASIILAGQPLDAIGALSRGQQAGAQVSDIRYQQDYRNAMSQYGAGALNGDPAAVNALAAFDPAAMQGLQSNALNMDATRQNMAVQQEQLAMARQQAAVQAQDRVAQLTAAEAAAAQQRLSSTLQGAMMAPDEATYNAYLQQNGIDPATAPFAQREMHAASVMGVLDVLEVQAQRAEMAAPPELPAGAQTLAWRAQEAGLQPGTPEYSEFMATGGVPKPNGMRLETRPDGTTVFVQGDVSGNDEPRMNPSSTAAMISSIDGILGDPALDWSTGILSPLQYLPGSPMYRFGTRSDQLEGQAFLQAFESLKGAGQITEIEGAKATQAIGRLDTGQSAADYRQALTELRDLLVTAQSRPQGWAATQANAAPAAPAAALPPTASGFVPSPPVGAAPAAQPAAPARAPVPAGTIPPPEQITPEIVAIMPLEQLQQLDLSRLSQEAIRAILARREVQ